MEVAPSANHPHRIVLTQSEQNYKNGLKIKSLVKGPKQGEHGSDSPPICGFNTVLSKRSLKQYLVHLCLQVFAAVNVFVCVFLFYM